MRIFSPGKGLLLAAGFSLLTGCASAPSAPQSSYQGPDLRDTDQDVVFGTEFPVSSKQEALIRAEAARENGDVDRALYFYVKALEFDPADAQLLATIGLMHQYQGNDQYAVRAYSLALDADPDYAAVLEARGLIMLSHGEKERALADLERSASLAPDSWRTHNGLGLLADARGDHAAAIGHYDRALAANPESGAVLNNRGYSKLLVGDAAGAEADLRKAANDLGHEQAWVNLGKMYANRGDYDLAVKALREALPVPEAFNMVAEVSMDNGDYGVATTLLEEAIRLSPTYFPDAEQNLVQLRLKAQTD